jgi:thiamine transport system permease protein
VLSATRGSRSGTISSWGKAGRVARIVIPLGFLGVFFLWPLVTILGRSLHIGAVADVFRDRSLRHVLWFTFWQAVLSTALALIAGLPAAYVVARYNFPGKKAFRAFVTVPFVLPTVVVATAFLALLRPGGPLAFLGWQRGVSPMILANVFFNLAVVIRTVGTFWANLDPRREDAARMLGASKARTFRSVTLPLLAPAVITAATIVFLFTFTSFGVALLLSDPAHATIEVEIYRQVVEFADLQTAAALALIQIAAVCAVLYAMNRAQERRAVAQRLVASSVSAHKPRGRERVVVAAVLGGTTLFLGGPLVLLAYHSFDTGGQFGLASYRALGTSAASSTLFVSPWAALRNSLLFATVATIVALVIGGLAAFAIASRPGRATRSFDTALMLPLGTSAVTVGFGFLITFDRAPLDLSTSWWIVPLAHAVVAIPFVIRIVVPALRSIDPRLRDAARMLGASPRHVWRAVDLPIATRAFVVAAGFCAAVSLGEFGATLFLARPDLPTLPIAIQRFLGRPGQLNVGQALALSTILMVLTAVVVFAIEHVRVGDVGEF